MIRYPNRTARLTAIGVLACAAMLIAGTTASAVEVPSTPDPVPVTLSAATTALVVLDITDQTCKPQVRCVEGMVPPGGPPILPEVAPAPNDPVFKGQGQDRFYNTDLDSMLKSHGITTVILVGWRENGSVLYTSVGATLRGYTVVVADDGTSAAQDYDVAIGRYQMLTQLSSNPMNQPLKPNAVTFSITDLITFQ